MYIESLRQSELSISSLGQAQAAISWIHRAAGETDPTDSAMVKNLISSAKRNAPPVKHTTPAEKAHLERIAKGLEENPTRTNRRTATLAVLIFAGCCRLDDVIGLQRWNFTFLDDGLKLFLPKIKNDQLRVGNTKWIPLANDERLCATSLLQTWFKSDEIDKDEKAPVFPMFTNRRKAISKTSFSEGLKSLLGTSDLPKITPHSFRAGFTTAAINRGADPSDLREYGVWASDSSMQKYASRSKGKKMETGRKAGL